jgi:uncharacterized membrane protein
MFILNELLWILVVVVVLATIIYSFKLAIVFIVDFIDNTNKNITNYFLKLISELDNEKSNDSFKRIVQILVPLISVIFLLNIFFLFNLDTNKYDIGKFGDFFGGLLNPILTFMTVFGLIVTIIMQRREIQENRQVALDEREELRKQNFDNTFFNLIKMHEDNVNSLTILDRNKKDIKGRQVFFNLLNVINEEMKEKKNNNKLKSDEAKDILSIVFKKHNYSLSSYFLTVYKILEYIDKSKIKDIDKQFYVDILRAKLSDIEMTLIFFYGMYRKGMLYKKTIENNHFFYLWIPLNIFSMIEIDIFELYDNDAFNFKGNNHKELIIELFREK